MLDRLTACGENGRADEQGKTPVARKGDVCCSPATGAMGHAARTGSSRAPVRARERHGRLSLSARRPAAPAPPSSSPGFVGRGKRGVARFTSALARPARTSLACSVRFGRRAACLLAAALALALTAQAAQAQSTAPQISSVAFTSAPTFDTDNDGFADTYGPGETIEVTVTWDKNVTWDVSAASASIFMFISVGTNRFTPAPLVTNGATSGTARSLAFRYTVVASDRDSDGVATPTSSFFGIVSASNGATLQDELGQSADVGINRPSEAAGPNHKVNGSLKRRPTDPPPAPARPAPGALVSNQGQSSAAALNMDADVSQVFRTGGNAAGYKLTRVDLALQAGTGSPAFTVTIEHDTDGVLGTLTNPAAIISGPDRFEAPGDGIDLKPNAAYRLVFDVTTPDNTARIWGTHANAEDAGAASGWSIDDSRRQRTHGATQWQPNTGKLKLAHVYHQEPRLSGNSA